MRHVSVDCVPKSRNKHKIPDEKRIVQYNKRLVKQLRLSKCKDLLVRVLVIANETSSLVILISARHSLCTVIQVADPFYRNQGALSGRFGSNSEILETRTSLIHSVDQMYNPYAMKWIVRSTRSQICGYSHWQSYSYRWGIQQDEPLTGRALTSSWPGPTIACIAFPVVSTCHIPTVSYSSKEFIHGV